MNKFAKLFLVISMVSVAGSMFAGKDCEYYKAQAGKWAKLLLIAPFDTWKPLTKEVEVEGKKATKKTTLPVLAQWPLGLSTRILPLAALVTAGIYVKNKCKCTTKKAREVTN